MGEMTNIAFTSIDQAINWAILNQKQHTGGPMAHILHAGGPWKLESPCRSQETGVNMAARQANKVPGGQWGPRVVGSRSWSRTRVTLTAWAPKQANTSS